MKTIRLHAGAIWETDDERFLCICWVVVNRLKSIDFESYFWKFAFFQTLLHTLTPTTRLFKDEIREEKTHLRCCDNLWDILFTMLPLQKHSTLLVQRFRVDELNLCCRESSRFAFLSIALPPFVLVSHATLAAGSSNSLSCKNWTQKDMWTSKEKLYWCFRNELRRERN